MTRRTWWSFLLGAALVLLLTGCSGLTARGEMKALIDDSAAVAGSDASRATLVQIEPAEARSILQRNAETFARYADAKTLNLFVYLFGGKPILVNGRYATLLDKTAAATEWTVMASAGQTKEWLNVQVNKESQLLIRVADARAGRKGD